MKPLFAVLVVGAVTWTAMGAFAQSSSLPSAADDPRLNRREARSYDDLVDHQSAFRAHRIHQECDSIQGDDLRRQCVDSFGASAKSGSSDQSDTARRR